MTPMRLIFLALAIWGSIHPMFYFTKWLIANDWDWAGMIDAWYVNDSATGLTWDLTIAAISLSIWIIIDSFKRRDLLSLVALPLTYAIGLSCGLPLYLFLRSRPAKAA
ncbi:K+-transporting ATPase, A chain [Rhodovulum sp. P5]|uniref:DUF2834 domain-containing protein n=1 Tax=Rhodovulum sp. P5 TaxID=1564506 RepID=UPI0009C3DB2F|nr:DUF2834 domain-containing protein [Rhodovulum sp. P5]ARE40237.1 K+-transporting ATPase, A chain [Rhodovulum sp. P5]